MLGMARVRRPEILVFLLCDDIVGSPYPGVTLVNLRNALVVPAFPTLIIQIRAYFEVRMPCGVHPLRIEFIEQNGSATMYEKSDMVEVGYDENTKAGAVGLGLKFQRAGWYAVRLTVGETVTERLLCVTTPEALSEFKAPNQSE